jgi:uncharacterized membrane protein
MESAPNRPQTNANWHWLKYALWGVMGLATISVTFYSEIPLLGQAQERAQLHALRWILIPHALAGLLALLTGPFQFSNRLRRRRRDIHRLLGRLYVGAVLVAAPLAILSTTYARYPKSTYFKIAIGIQGTAWIITTVVAVVAALGRHLALHREWMIRSYAVTFTFIATRVLQPIPAWNRMGRAGFAMAIVCITFLAVLVPQIAQFLRYLADCVSDARNPSSPEIDPSETTTYE